MCSMRNWPSPGGTREIQLSRVSPFKRLDSLHYDLYEEEQKTASYTRAVDIRKGEYYIIKKIISLRAP